MSTRVPNRALESIQARHIWHRGQTTERGSHDQLLRVKYSAFLAFLVYSDGPTALLILLGIGDSGFGPDVQVKC